jgi:hypothetical protein
MSAKRGCPLSMRIRKAKFNQELTLSFDWDRLRTALSCAVDAKDIFGRLADIALPPAAAVTARYFEMLSRHAECFTRLLDDAGVASSPTGSITHMAALEENWPQALSNAADTVSFVLRRSQVLTAYKVVLRGNPPTEVARKVGFLLGEMQQLVLAKDFEPSMLLPTTYGPS